MNNHIVLKRRKPWCKRIIGLKYKSRKVKKQKIAIGLELANFAVEWEEQPDGSFVSLSRLEGIYMAVSGNNPWKAIIFAKEDVCWQVPAPENDWDWRIE